MRLSTKKKYLAAWFLSNLFEIDRSVGRSCTGLFRYRSTL